MARHLSASVVLADSLDISKQTLDPSVVTVSITFLGAVGNNVCESGVT